MQLGCKSVSMGITLATVATLARFSSAVVWRLRGASTTTGPSRVESCCKPRPCSGPRPRIRASRGAPGGPPGSVATLEGDTRAAARSGRLQSELGASCPAPPGHWTSQASGE